MADPLDVVFVCTGNRFRSPVAEALFRKLTDGLPVRVRSAGTQEIGSLPVLPEALDLASELEIDLSAHRSRALAGDDLSGADLVLGFERRHVAAAVVDAGADRERSFTILELAGLLDSVEPPGEEDPVERARAAIARAHAARLRAGRDAASPEIADPLGGPVSGYRDTASRLEELTGGIAAGLFGPR